MKSARKRATRTEAASHDKLVSPAGDKALSARAVELARIVAQLAPKTHLVIQDRDGKRTTANYYNQMVTYDLLMDDAEYILAAAERRDRTQHAFGLFLSTERYLSIEGIVRVFKAAKWRGLTAWESCENLLGEILKALREHLAQNLVRSGRFKIETVDSSHFQIDVPILPAEELEFWVHPNELTDPAGTWELNTKCEWEIQASAAGGQVRYWAERIFLLAHLLCRERFQSRISRPKNC